MFGRAQVARSAVAASLRRGPRLAMAAGLALSILATQVGAAFAASYQTETLTTYYGGKASSLVVAATGSIHVQPAMTDEGYSQQLAVLLWVDDGSGWKQSGDWRHATTRNWAERTGASTYWNYGPASVSGRLCFYAYYRWLRSTVWVGFDQHLGCYRV